MLTDKSFAETEVKINHPYLQTRNKSVYRVRFCEIEGVTNVAEYCLTIAALGTGRLPSLLHLTCLPFLWDRKKIAHCFREEFSCRPAETLHVAVLDLSGVLYEKQFPKIRRWVSTGVSGTLVSTAVSGMLVNNREDQRDFINKIFMTI